MVYIACQLYLNKVVISKTKPKTKLSLDVQFQSICIRRAIIYFQDIFHTVLLKDYTEIFEGNLFSTGWLCHGLK